MVALLRWRPPCPSWSAGDCQGPDYMCRRCADVSIPHCCAQDTAGAEILNPVTNNELKCEVLGNSNTPVQWFPDLFMLYSYTLCPCCAQVGGKNWLTFTFTGSGLTSADEACCARGLLGIHSLSMPISSVCVVACHLPWPNSRPLVLPVSPCEMLWLQSTIHSDWYWLVLCCWLYAGCLTGQGDEVNVAKLWCWDRAGAVLA